MSIKKMPFNIKILEPSKSRLDGLLAIDSSDIYDSSQDFHPRGLYSSEVFGKQGTESRRTKHSYIDLKTTVIHPKLFLELSRLKGLYKGILSGTVYATWDAKLKDFVKSDILDGSTGYKFFIDHFSEMDILKNESITRELRVDLINKYRTAALTRYFIVLPAGLRDIEVTDGRTVEDDVNGLYRKLIRASNTISMQSVNSNTSALDTIRWSMQRTAVEIYEYLENILVGKRGFLLAKWGARVIDGGTRNVITGMDPAPRILGDSNYPGINHTLVGLHQFMKGTVELSIHSLRNGPFGDFVSGLPNAVSVVDRETLQPKIITPSKFIKDRWGSDEGIEGLINGFGKIDSRHKPVIIDGDYLALIYKTPTVFKIFHDIRELPENLDRGDVRPITWTEMFYISVIGLTKKTATYVTRYPITENGSIYPTLLYLKTTITGDIIEQLGDDWSPSSLTVAQLPRLNDPFFDSMSVHPSRVIALGADYDGDKCSLNIVSSKEAVQEVIDYLDSMEAYINPNGGLKYGVNNHIVSLVLFNFTRGLLTK